MTLKPNYLRVVLMVYIWIAAALAFSFVIQQMTGGGPAQTFDHLVSLLAVGGILMVIAVSVMFVPREIKYDSEGFSCRMIIQGSHFFRWTELEAYGTGNNVFLLKFSGHQAIQISSFGFSRSEWKSFKEYIYTTYPAKKCRFWLGPKPLIKRQK